MNTMAAETPNTKPQPTGEMPGIREQVPEMIPPTSPAADAEMRRGILGRLEREEDPLVPEADPVHGNRDGVPGIDEVIGWQRRMTSPNDGLGPDAIAYRAEVKVLLAEVKRDIERFASRIGDIDAMSLWRRPLLHWKRQELERQYRAAIAEEHRLTHQLEIIEFGKAGDFES